MSYVPSPAGFWKRYVAYFVDVLLLSTVLNVLMGAVLSLVGMGQSLRGMFVEAAEVASPEAWLLAHWHWFAWITAGSVLAYAVLAAVYFIWLEASPRQATFGKQLAGIRVTALDGGPPTRGQVVGRFFASGLGWLTLNLGHALAAWTPQRRALHDYLAGTRVENVDPANTAMPTWGWIVIAVNVLGLVVTVLATVAVAWVIVTQLQGLRF